MAKKVFKDRLVFDDGTIVEAKAWKVPKNEKYPEGIKYGFQHYDPETGETLLRYDNYNKHSNSQHHKHLKNSETKPTDFKSLKNHYKKFLEEVRNQK